MFATEQHDGHVHLCYVPISDVDNWGDHINEFSSLFGSLTKEKSQVILVSLANQLILTLNGVSYHMDYIDLFVDQ